MTVVAACYDGSLHGFEAKPVGAVGGDSAESEAEADADAMSLAFAYRPHVGCVKSVAVSSVAGEFNVSRGGAEYLASGGSDEVIKIYNLRERREIGELTEHQDSVLALAFVGNAFLLSGGNDGKLLIWRCRDWGLVSDLKGHKPGPVTSLAPHPTGKVALSTSNDNSLRLWNLETARPASRNHAEGFRVLDLATWEALEGSYYAVVADSASVLLFDAADTSGKPSCELKQPCRVNALLCNASFVIVGREDGVIIAYPVARSGDAGGLRVDEAAAVEARASDDTRVRSLAASGSKDPALHGVFHAGLSDGRLQQWTIAGDEPRMLSEQRLGSTAHLTCMACSSSAVTEADKEEKEEVVAKEKKTKTTKKTVAKKKKGKVNAQTTATTTATKAKTTTKKRKSASKGAEEDSDQAKTPAKKVMKKKKKNATQAQEQEQEQDKQQQKKKKKTPAGTGSGRKQQQRKRGGA